MNKPINSKPSLVDAINPVNELVSIQEISNGLRFRFTEKILPGWFTKMARSHDFAMLDNDPSRASGRDVSLVNDRHISPVTYRSKRR